MGGKSIYPFLWVLLITILLFLWMFGKKKSKDETRKKQQPKKNTQKFHRRTKHRKNDGRY